MAQKTFAHEVIINGEACVILIGHTKSVTDTTLLADGRIVSWSLDHTIRVWDAEGQLYAVLDGHANEIMGAIQLIDGRVLSLSYDKSLSIWWRDANA